MNMRRKSILTALLLIGSVSAMNQENYSESDVKSMLTNILQSFQSGEQRRAEQMQTLMDQMQTLMEQYQLRD